MNSSETETMTSHLSLGLAVLTASMVTVLLCLGGCVSTGAGGGRELSETGRVLLREAAGIAVDHFVAGSTDASARIQRIHTVIEKARTTLSAAETATIADLRKVIDAELDRFNLSELERADARRFLNILQAVLMDYIGGEQKLDARGLVKLNDFLGIVEGFLPP